MAPVTVSAPAELRNDLVRNLLRGRNFDADCQVGRLILSFARIQELVELAKWIWPVEQRSGSYGPGETLEGSLRPELEVNEEGRRANQRNGRWVCNPSPARSQHHVAQFLELPCQFFFQRPKTLFAALPEDLADGHSFAPLDLGVEIQERALEPLAEELADRGFPRAGKANEHDMRLARISR